MKKLLLIFFPIITLAQTRVADTAVVFINQEINVPVNGVSFLRNVNYVNVSVNLLKDDRITLVREYNTQRLITNDFKLRTEDPIINSFYCYMKDTLFQEEGTYNYQFNLRGRYALFQNAPIDQPTNEIQYFPIKLKYPQLAAEDNNRDTLFWGEEFQYSIAMVEYSNKNAYCYEIYMNDNIKPATVVKGTPVVDLTKFLDEYSAEKDTNTIKVIGKYNSRTFKYYDNKNVLKESIWTFPIKKPTIH
ncbi:MAG: hypothetical protein ABSA76_11735, partial [Bacteroidales bacterium]